MTTSEAKVIDFSWLEKGGENLFQAIKEKKAKAKEKGINIIDLSIGQPAGAALFSACQAASRAILSRMECTHEYQDNISPGCKNFAKRFVHFHIKTKIKGTDNLAYLPIPGIKSMLGLVIMACGAGDKKMRRDGKKLYVATMTSPGYPTPKTWCEYLEGLGVVHTSLVLRSENDFLPTIEDLEKAFPAGERGLLMLNLPGNPGGQIATAEWLRKVCAFCWKRGIRIFNDSAYSALDHSGKHVTLTDIALEFSGLQFVEAFSASKLINNGTGWRVGAMVGTICFISDIKRIKGNTDSGFNAALAKGVIWAVEHDKETIEAVRIIYKNRIETFVKILSKSGMQLAVEPKAGFFTLWKVPDVAFGKKIKDAAHFNNLMIESTGVLGVPFGQYIRYAICRSSIKRRARQLELAFAKANVRYYSNRAKKAS